MLHGLRGALPTGIGLAAPIMPDPDNPDAERWLQALGEHLRSIEEDRVLVGHSLGGSTILQYLALHSAPPRLRGVVTIASPFWGMPDWDFREFALPADLRQLRGIPVILYGSTDDEMVPIAHLERYAAVLPRATMRRVSGTGHLFDNGPHEAIAADVLRLFGGATGRMAGDRGSA